MERKSLSKSFQTTCGVYWSSECTPHAFVTSVTSRHVWLKSGSILTSRSLTARSASGVYVWGHAFNKKENTLSIGCETVDKTVCHWPLITCNVNFNFQPCTSDVNTRSQAVVRIADRTAKNCRGHVTEVTPTFRESYYLCACSALPIQSRVSNLKCLAQVVLKICSIVCQKL